MKLGHRGAQVLVVLAVAVVVADAGRAASVWGQEAGPGGDEPTPPIEVRSPIRAVPLADSRISVDGAEYRGDVEISVEDGRLQVVNAVKLEEYLLGVDGMPTTWPAEALKAQAVASRSLAARWMSDRTSPAETGEYDTCATSACQVYVGVAAERREGADAWLDAVTSTDGEVLRSGGKPALARYHNTAGGRTRPASDVFGGSDVSYSVAQDAPFEGDAPLRRWVAAFPHDDLRRILARGNVDVPGELTGLRVDDVPDGDGPDFVVLQTPSGDVRLPAEAFTEIVNKEAPELFPTRYPGAGPIDEEHGLHGQLPLTLPSAVFTAETAGERVMLKGRGFGHLVGMSQQSARGMAEHGWSHERILGHFFGGLQPEEVALPGTIRILIASGAEEVRIGSRNGMRFMTGDDDVVVDDALLEWTLRAGPDDTLALVGPPGAGAPLAVTGFSVPLRVRTDDLIPVEFVLSKPARVTVEVQSSDGGQAVVNVADRTVLAAGPHEVEAQVAEPGVYEIAVSASDGADATTTETLAVEVESDKIGPSVVSFLGLVAVLGTLVAGAAVFRRTARR